MSNQDSKKFSEHETDHGVAETHGRKSAGDGDMNHEDPKQERPETAPTNVSRDVQSDPALNDQTGQEWADEGGATPTGPATSST